MLSMFILSRLKNIGESHSMLTVVQELSPRDHAPARRPYSATRHPPVIAGRFALKTTNDLMGEAANKIDSNVIVCLLWLRREIVA